MAEMLMRMSSREFSEWMAYDTIELEDQRRAELAATAKAGRAARQQRPPRRRPT